MDVKKIKSPKGMELGRTEETSYAFFFLDGREFGIEVEHVRETIGLTTDLIQMPCSMDVMDGLINLRSAIIPIINLRTRFKIESPPPPTNECRIAITCFNGHLFGLLFDEISGVVRVKQCDISSVNTPEVDFELCNQGIISLNGGKRIVQLLDLERLFLKYNLPLIDNETDETRLTFRPLKQDITFMLQGQEYALDVQAIKEIISPPEIRRKVLVNEAIKGVIDLRGELVSVVSLRTCFGLPSEDLSKKSRLILLQNNLSCGILVDAIQEVIHYEEDQLLPIPGLEEERETFSGIVALESGRNIIKINPDQLFDETLLNQIQSNTDLHQEGTEASNPNEKYTDIACTDIATRVLISFRLEEAYAFDILLFQEIINYSSDIISLPGREPYFEGILNLRQQAIPIINLRRYYGMEISTTLNESKIIILNVHEKTIGIMVDEIIEIVKPDRMEITPIPKFAKGQEHAAQSHVQDAYRFQTTEGEDKVLLMYDVEKLIDDIEDVTKPHSESLFQKRINDDLTALLATEM